MTTITSPYIFWLFDWGIFPVNTSLRYYPLYARCDINEQGITIQLGDETIAITYAQIVTCEKHLFIQSASAGRAYNVKIILHKDVQIQKGRFARNEIYLVPVKMFANEPSAAEIDDMAAVINAFASHNESTIPKNPYQRELIRRGRAADFSEATWNALTPPNVYTPVPSFGRKLLAILLIVCGVSFIGLVITAIIYNLFHYLAH